MKATLRCGLGLVMGVLLVSVSAGSGESIFTASDFLVKIESLPLAEELYYALDGNAGTVPPRDPYYVDNVAEGYVVVENRGREPIDLEGLSWLVEAFSEPAYNKPVIADGTDARVVIWPPPIPIYETRISPIEESLVHPNAEVAVARFEVYLRPVPPVTDADAAGADPVPPVLYQSPDTRIVIRACPRPEEVDGEYRRICSTRIVCVMPRDPATGQILNAVRQAEINTAAAIEDVDRGVKTNQGILWRLYLRLVGRPK